MTRVTGEGHYAVFPGIFNSFPSGSGTKASEKKAEPGPGAVEPCQALALLGKRGYYAVNLNDWSIGWKT